MRRISAATAGFAALAAGWAVFAAIYAWGPLPRDAWAKPKTGLAGAVASFDRLHYRTARQEFAKLAGAGNRQGEMWLAYMNEHGFGANRDVAAAIAEYQQAANAGSAEAARRLGELYLRGDGVLQDVDAARQWLTRAAAKGDAPAERYLGELYANGLGVAQDPAQAYAWLDLAASHGDALAARERDRVLARLSPPEIRHAKQLAEAEQQGIAPPENQAPHAPAA